jgi:hypothetical protein
MPGNERSNAMKKSLIALATIGVLASGAAAADSFTLRVGDRDGRSFVTVQDYDYDFRRWHDEGRRMGIDERQARINARIERGLQTGALTRREARQLERQLALTEEKERAFEADGRLNGRERAELHRDLDNVTARLRYERHDADRRY